MCSEPPGRSGGAPQRFRSLEPGELTFPSPHLPVRHRLAFELAVGVGPQSRQLLLAGESPVPLLATVVVHAPLSGQGNNFTCPGPGSLEERTPKATTTRWEAPNPGQLNARGWPARRH